MADRVIDGLRTFDVIGVAGNRVLRGSHVGWGFINDGFDWDTPANLSGAVAHGACPTSPISFYGQSPSQCELLDGVFLAAHRGTLRDKGVHFDPRFRFHFYDLDFCRSAVNQGLRLGTWPIALTHNSGGAFGTPEWRAALKDYRQKWA